MSTRPHLKAGKLTGIGFSKSKFWGLNMAEAPERANFQPNWASPPGETIRELLDRNNLSVGALADHLRMPLDAAHALIGGHIRIDQGTADKLSSCLGGSAKYWATRDAQYVNSLQRLRASLLTAQSPQSWLELFPLKDMVSLGWLDKSTTQSRPIEACLNFFGVDSLDSWNTRYSQGISAAFRTSSSLRETPGSTLAWLRKCELEAESISCKKWNRDSFINSLPDIRELTRTKSPDKFIPALQEICANSGVAVVVVRAPAGCRASGATRFLSSDKALLALSFRHLSDDHFWFTFFHEAGHLVLHEKGKIFLDGPSSDVSEEEREANTFSELTLLPDNLRAEFNQLRIDAREIVRFSRRARISPGIVVGQLQHHGRIPRHHFNGLKSRYMWA